MPAEGGSAGDKARRLRRQAAEARLKAERMESMADRWEAGEVGEQRVAAVLAPLQGEHCRVLHDRLLQPGKSKANLDHIVVSVAGIYLIDAKNWSGDVRVVDGNLQKVQHGRTWQMNDQLDKVRQMADQLANDSSVVVYPVICLAGDGADSFGEPVLVRRVFVVPVSRLANWLLSRPRQPMPVDLRSQAVRIAASFPSATEPAFLSVPSRLRSRTDAAARPLPASRPGSQTAAGRPGSRAPAKRRRGRRHAAIKALVGLGLVLGLMTGFGRQLASSTSQAFGRVLASRLSQAPVKPAATTWAAPCLGIDTAQLSQLTGHRAYPYATGANDSCSWGFVPRPYLTAAGNIRIVTGWAAKYNGHPVTQAAHYFPTTTSETLAVPQFSAVPKCAVSAKSITQPMVVTITWKNTPLTASIARADVTTLACDLASHLPTGPSASKVVPR